MDPQRTSSQNNSTPEPVTPSVPPVQPSATTTQPTMPQDAAPAVQASAPAPTSGARSMKKIITIVAGVLVLGLGILAYMMLSGPSQADYKQASDTAKSLRTAYEAIKPDTITSFTNADELQTAGADMKAAAQLFDKKFTELGTMKAVTGDKEIAALYEVAKTKKVKFDASLVMATEALDTILPPLVEGMESTGAGSDKLKALRLSIESIKDIKDETNKKLVSDVIAELKGMESLALKIEAGRADPKKVDSTAQSAYYDAADKFSSTMRTWQTGLEKKLTEAEMKDDLTKLTEAIFDKSIGR